MRTILVPAAILSAMLIAPRARAQDPGAALFRKGLALYRSGNTAAACDAFGQSYKLQPATGTLFNLAKCHATEGRYWDARGEFLKLAGEMDAAGKSGKAQIARNQAASAEAHLPRIALAFRPQSNASEISIDGNTIDAEKWHQPIPVAPGSHVLTFAADGKKTEARTVEAQGHATVAVNVPALNALTEHPAEDGATPHPSAHSTLPDQGAAGWSSGKTAGVVAGGVAFVAGAAVGVGFTVVAGNDRNQRDALLGGNASLCSGSGRPQPTCSQISGFDRDAHTNQTIGIVGFTVAGVAAVGTLALLLWPHEANNTAIVPVVSRRSAGLAAAGSF